MTGAPRGDWPRRLALLGVANLTVMSTAIVAPALPRMAESFPDVANAAFLTRLVLTLPAMFIVVCAPLAGAIIDRFGRRRFLLGALALYGGAGIAGTFLSDLHWILASRALLGVAIAGTLTTMTTLVGDYFQSEARARFTATQSMVMSLGSAVSILIGGALAEANWRLSFLVYGFGWLMILPAFLWLPEPKRSMPSAQNPQSDEPVPKLKIALVYAVTMFGLAMFYLIPVQLPFLLRSIGIDSPMLAGCAIGTAALSSAVSPMWYARIRRRVGFGGVYAAAFSLMGCGYLIVSLFPSYGVILLGLVVVGSGIGLFFPNNHMWLLSLAPPALRGRLSGGLASGVFLGQFFSPIVSQPVVVWVGLSGAFAVFSGVLIVVAIAFSRLSSTR